MKGAMAVCIWERWGADRNSWLVLMKPPQLGAKATFTFIFGFLPAFQSATKVSPHSDVQCGVFRDKCTV